MSPVRKVLIGLPLVVLLVLAGAATGLVTITASSGHWAITEWFLHFAMRRSVVTHAMLVDEPPIDLDDEALILQGAGHYESGCRVCHGAPGQRLPPVPAAMTPHPPALGPRVSQWRPRELFYIVRHGVKMTGMPAWPDAGREDEVWAVVAFLRQLPGMEPDRYRELALGAGTSAVAAGDAEVPDVVVRACARCHGVDGLGRGAAFPPLAGQRLGYLRRALDGYAANQRHSGIMEPVVAHLSAEQREQASQHYAALPPPPAQPVVDAQAVERGRRLASEGNPRRHVPACAECHLPSGSRINDAYPLLAGQSARYLAQQLRLMQARKRGGSDYLHLMHEFVDDLDEHAITDVAAFFASSGGRRP
jgi:cytochrome c553